MRIRVNGVGSCWLLICWLSSAAAGCGSDTSTGSMEEPDTTESEPTSEEEREPTASKPSKPAEKHTDPMGIGQESMPKTADVPVDELDSARFPEPGATSFETAKPDNESASISTSRPSIGGASTSSAPVGGVASGPTSGAPTTPTTMSPSTAPGQTPSNPGSAQREIVEADIVQAHGDVLYVLNRFRGLVLIDMTQPDQPSVIGRVPFQAQPVDMYVRDGKAYIVMSDYFVYWQFDSDADPQGFHGSQLLVVDVADPHQPKEVSGFKVQGEITDTRIVGDVLYAVSKRNPEYWRYDTQDWKDTTWVLSIDVANPSDVKKVDEKEFPGAANIIQVYESAISIAALDPNYYLVDEDNAQQTLVTFIDISDAKGKINVGGKTYVPGMVQDKFKMDLSDGVLRIVSNNWYWQPQSAATLTLFDAKDPTKLEQLSQIPLTLDIPNVVQPAQVGATRFAGNAFFESLCWWEMTVQIQSCRLDVYDLTDPSAPVRATTVPVDGPITHFEARDTRLLSLGLHIVGPGQGQQVQVGLFDVAQLAATQRISVADLGLATNSAALGDYKAFKVLEDLGMLLLPLSWYDTLSNGQRAYRQGAQIIDWMNDQVTVRGRIAQTGSVERAIAFKDRVVSISTQQVQVIDASDRDQPKQTGNLFLVRNVTDAFSIGGFEVQIGVDEEDSTYKFYVLPFGEDDMGKSVAELEIGTNVFYTLRDGDVIHLIGYDSMTGGQIIRNADFSNPMMPRFRGEYRIPEEIQHIYNGGCGYRGYCSFYDYYWNPAAGQALNNQLLPVTVREVNAEQEGRRFYRNYLRMIDLRDIDNPKLAEGSIEMPEWPFVNRVGHGKMLYSTHTEPALDQNGNPKQYHERYFLDRVDASNPDEIIALPAVSIPGRLVDVDASGKILYTIDYQWDEHGRRRNSFNVLSLDGDTATLKEVLPVGDEIGRARYLDREVWLSSAGYPWWGRQDDSPDSRQPYTRLTRLRFDEQAELTSTDTHDIEGYHFNLLDVEGTRVYLSTSRPYGLLILDTSDFKNPNVLGASRTIGYVSKVIRDDDYLYLPMGSYGVRRVQAP
jgi:hypothetical protein